ncbi:ABC transporter substrate-binding protein [Abyssalbus ytuae]|uniref:SsuA/THI5-like domain-containing protein n=1 Tax=Abyssalbus ytuae TaxID=2926907 RepID=A0A9E6ZLQ8_9FLAO|nr:hypothetical protein [Abyssalbus ytuae]UOB18122.1 hypothetical protein MQE35_02205 [Abyssalbus ytuae]
MKSKVNFKLLPVLIITSFLFNACSSDNPDTAYTEGDALAAQAERYEETLKVVSPPNPNVFPLLLAMSDYPHLNIELIPVDGGSAVPPALENGTAEVTTIYSYIMANHVVTESAPDLRLAAVTLWSNFYIVSHPDISSFDDLVGKKLIISGPNGPGENGAPGKIIRAALKREGLEPGVDLTVEYLPLSEGLETVSSGNADAILLAEPAATGFALQSFMENNDLEITINLQETFTGYNQWDENELPLGGIGVIDAVLNNEQKKKQFDEFVKAYRESCNKIMQGNMEDLMVISQGLYTEFGFQLPAPIILRSVNEGRLVFKPGIELASIQPDLDSFISEIIGSSPGEEFYYYQ